jgi:integrase/recombinase XerD
MPNASNTNSFLELELLNAEKDLYDLKNGKIVLTDLFKSKSKVTFGEALNQELLRLKREFKSGLYDKVLALKRQINDSVITISEMDRNWFESMITDMRKLGNIGSTIQKKIKLIRGIISRYSEFEISKEHVFHIGQYLRCQIGTLSILVKNLKFN